MTTQTAPVQLGVVPAPKEIENTMGARKILEAAIEDFKNKRSTAKAELANSLGKDLAVAQLDVASAMSTRPKRPFQHRWRVYPRERRRETASPPFGAVLLPEIRSAGVEIESSLNVTQELLTDRLFTKRSSQASSR